jgi:hypothetical protein
VCGGSGVPWQEFNGGEASRTAAVMQATAQHVRRVAARLHASAAAARSERTAVRLRALGNAALVQADAITRRASRLLRPIENGAELPRPADDTEPPVP